MLGRGASARIFIVLLAGLLILPFAVQSAEAEPNMVTILNTLGFVNITESSDELFPAGVYNVTLYAEFAAYHSSNELSWYTNDTSEYNLIFSDYEGNFEYVDPPLRKQFTVCSQFGLSFLSPEARYFTENGRNPDCLKHSLVYLNLDDPTMFLIGFENMLGGGDRDYQDMIISLQFVAPCKHHLVVDTDPFGLVTIPGTDWYVECTYVDLNAPQVVSVSSDVRYRFDYWDVDAAIITGNPITVHMDTDHNATAHYVKQYFLTVISPYDTPGGSDWYDENTTTHATLTYGVEVIAPEVQAVFTGWVGDASGSDLTSDPIVMDEPKTAIADWILQYYLDVITDPSTIPSIPGAGWYDNCTWVSLTASVYVPDEDGADGVRYKFDYWDVDGTPQGNGSNTIDVHMESPHVATAHHTLQYYLTVQTDPGGLIPTPAGQGWYQNCTYVKLRAPSTGCLDEMKHLFGYWDVDGEDFYNYTIQVHMDAPHIATAYYALPTSRHLDAEPPRLIDLTEPVSTLWDELHPSFGRHYSIKDWSDTDHDGGLSPSDYVGIWDEDTHQNAVPYWWHVDDVTVTMKVTKQSTNESIYFEFEGGFERYDRVIVLPEKTYWYEVYPYFGDHYQLEEWNDNCNSVLGYCDYIVLRSETDGNLTEYHVEVVKTDLIITAKASEIRPCETKEYFREGSPQIIHIYLDNYYANPITYTVSAYHNGLHLIGSQTITLNPLESGYATIIWTNTSMWPKGIYAINVTVAIQFPDSTSIFMNINTTFHITSPGDLNGDEIVNLKDIAIAARAFGTKVCEPRWNPDVDVNNDFSIDLRDVAEIVQNFGNA